MNKALELTNNATTNFEMGKDETQFASKSTKKIYHDIKRKLNDLNAKNVTYLNLKKNNSNLNNNTNNNNNNNDIIGHHKTETIGNSSINNKSSTAINKIGTNSNDIGETETNICTSITTKNTNSKVTHNQINNGTAGDDDVTVMT